MIRPGTEADVETVARLGEQFHAEAVWSEIVDYVQEDCEGALRTLLAQGILLVAEEGGEIVGMAGGMVFPFYFNAAHMTGNELFLWVRPDRRGIIGLRLLRAMEDAARVKGCKSFGMALMASVRPDKTEQFYLRNGYRPIERTFVKVF